MLRATTNLLNRLTLQEVKSGNSSFALEFVRWRRKPRWVPVAKSKMFRVPERRKQPIEEYNELKRLNNIYRTQIRSVRQYLRLEAQRIQETTTADHIVMSAEQEEADFQKRMQINAEWNEKIAIERNSRLAKQREEQAAYVKERLESARLREEENLERIEAIVRKEKELSKTFITREKLDDAIAHALANPIDYNFSIDLQGNIYRGRTTLPGNSGTPAPQTQDNSERDELQATN